MHLPNSVIIQKQIYTEILMSVCLCGKAARDYAINLHLICDYYVELEDLLPLFYSIIELAAIYWTEELYLPFNICLEMPVYSLISYHSGDTSVQTVHVVSNFPVCVLGL